MHLKNKWLLFFTLLLFTLACEKEEVGPGLKVPVGGESVNTAIKVIMDVVEGTPVVLAGSSGLNLVVAFESTLDGTQLMFSPVNGELPVIMSDEEGSRWDIFGLCVSGPRKGARLESLNAGMGYWFIFGAMYPGADIYQGESREVIYEGKRSSEWSIPINTLFQVVGQDAISSLQDPSFEEFNVKDVAPFYLEDSDLVMGVFVNGEIKAYPHKVLDWHEIINDHIGGQPLAVTYCPLTGTGKIWDRTLADGSLTTFGVSGFLYNSNIMPYDRTTNSIWTQLDNKCVNGPLIDEGVEIIPFVETSWGTWKTMFRRPLILSENSGAGRNYQVYPYGDYRTNHDFLAFPVSVDDDRLPRKERVFGIVVEGKAKVYRLTDFD